MNSRPTAAARTGCITEHSVYGGGRGYHHLGVDLLESRHNDPGRVVGTSDIGGHRQRATEVVAERTQSIGAPRDQDGVGASRT